MALKTKREVKKELNKITDTVDLVALNKIIKDDNMLQEFSITDKTLKNIGSWALDGKSEFEIAHNLELSAVEWRYLCKICPAIVAVMQHSQAYADIVLAGTLFQTAIGGKIIKRKVPMKVKEYNKYGKVCGEHYETVEIEEETQPNPMLLKFLAENKMSEKFGKTKVDNSKEHRDIIDNMTEDERKAIEEMSVNG